MKRLCSSTSCLEEYAKHGTAQAELRHECVRRLQQKIAGQYQSLLDPMAGVGRDAEVFAAPNTIVNDIDPACRERLGEKFASVSAYDFFNSQQRAALYSLIKPDLVYLDFNNYTLAKWTKGTYREELEDSFATAQKFVILNDCSSFGLRMWTRRFYPLYSKILGVEVSSVDSYLAALPAFYKRHHPAWTLMDMERFFAASPKGNGGTTYLLFGKANHVA